MQADDVRDDALIDISHWQVLQQIAHLEEEYDEDGKPNCKDVSYLVGRSIPNSVAGTGTKLEDRSEKEDRKN